MAEPGWADRLVGLEAEALGAAVPASKECATLGHERGQVIGRVCVRGRGGFSAAICVCKRCGQWFSVVPPGVAPKGRKGESRRKA